MFCSTCGKQINENLNFCKNCGARIDSGIEIQNSSHSLISMAIMGVMSIFGLFGFVFLVIKLVEKNLDPSLTFMLLALYVAAILGICFLLFKQTLNQNFKPRKKENSNEPYSPEQLSGVSTAQLNESSFQTPFPSVTDNTTRTFKEVLIERR